MGEWLVICEECYHEKGCKRKLDENGRCAFYVKKNRVAIGDDVDVNPMDTITFDYDDIKKLFDDEDLTEEQRKELGL